MKILFKDNHRYYFIINDYLAFNSINTFMDIKLNNITHLDDAEVLYHYRVINSDILLPVYYEYNGKFITKYNIFDYRAYTIDDDLIRDNTLVNIKLLDNI